MIRTRLALLLSALFAGAGLLPAQAPSSSTQLSDRLDWLDWRGPSQDGRAHSASKPPLEWDAASGENILWKTAIRGAGHSTPVVLGKHAWLTTATPDGTRMWALCIDVETGKILHDLLLKENTAPEPLGNPVNNYAAPSCAIEPGAVYVHFGTYGTFCLDPVTGEEQWRREDIHCRHYRGPGSSPIVWKDLLILSMDGVDVQYVTALNKRTGETVWKSDRLTDWDDLDKDGRPQREGDARKAYVTPIIATVDGEEQLITTASKNAFGYDPATGEQLWAYWHGGFSNASRPLFDPREGGIAYVNSGYGKAQLHAVKLAGARGTIDPATASWVRTKNVPNRSTPVLLDGHLYSVDDGGITVCADAATGKEVWRERLRGKYAASPVLAGGHLYFISLEGFCSVVKASPTYEKVFETKMPDGSGASPAVTGNSLLLRTGTELYRIGPK